jgi:malate dehydrogenase
MTKVAIVGAGNIGATIGFLVANRADIDELVFIDIAKDLAEGQAADISHSLAYRSDTKVISGDYEDAKGADIFVMSAGKPRSPGMTRLDLAQFNAKIVRDVASKIKDAAPDCKIVTMTNPMDLMNYFLYKETGFPRERVIGSGGMLDSSRFRFVLAREFGVGITEVEAYVLGQHGESQVPVFSRVKVKGETKTFSGEKKEELRDKTRKSAISVIEKKGATVFAPTNHTAAMVEAILDDEKKLMPCSAVLKGEYGVSGVSLGVPVILGKNGIEGIVEWELDDYEIEIFSRAAEKLKEAKSQLNQ